MTETGATARTIAKNRPACQTVSCSTSDRVLRQLNMAWGTYPLKLDEQDNTDALFASAVEVTQAAGIIKDGDLVVITAGSPVGVPGTTNMMKVHVVGDPIQSQPKNGGRR